MKFRVNLETAEFQRQTLPRPHSSEVSEPQHQTQFCQVPKSKFQHSQLWHQKLPFCQMCYICWIHIFYLQVGDRKLHIWMTPKLRYLEGSGCWGNRAVVVENPWWPFKRGQLPFKYTSVWPEGNAEVWSPYLLLFQEKVETQIFMWNVSILIYCQLNLKEKSTGQ